MSRFMKIIFQMKTPVRFIGHYNQIRESIIGSDAIFVMDNFLFIKLAAKFLLHFVSMFFNPILKSFVFSNFDKNISVRESFAADWLPARIARFAPTFPTAIPDFWHEVHFACLKSIKRFFRMITNRQIILSQVIDDGQPRTVKNPGNFKRAFAFVEIKFFEFIFGQIKSSHTIDYNIIKQE